MRILLIFRRRIDGDTVVMDVFRGMYVYSWHKAFKNQDKLYKIVVIRLVKRAFLLNDVKNTEKQGTGRGFTKRLLGISPH